MLVVDTVLVFFCVYDILGLKCLNIFSVGFIAPNIFFSFPEVTFFHSLRPCSAK